MVWLASTTSASDASAARNNGRNGTGRADNGQSPNGAAEYRRRIISPLFSGGGMVASALSSTADALRIGGTLAKNRVLSFFGTARAAQLMQKVHTLTDN